MLWVVRPKAKFLTRKTFYHPPRWFPSKCCADFQVKGNKNKLFWDDRNSNMEEEQLFCYHSGKIYTTFIHSFLRPHIPRDLVVCQLFYWNYGAFWWRGGLYAIGEFLLFRAALILSITAVFPRLKTDTLLKVPTFTIVISPYSIWPIISPWTLFFR